jgi:hypothetical protein
VHANNTVWRCDNALPFGVSLIAPAFQDLALLDLGARFQHVAGVSRGDAHALLGALPIFCAVHQISVERYVDRLISHIALQQHEWIIAA